MWVRVGGGSSRGATACGQWCSLGSSAAASALTHSPWPLLLPLPLPQLEEHGGEDATAVIRRYARGWDPVVSEQCLDRLAAKRGPQPPFKPYTLI